MESDQHERVNGEIEKDGKLRRHSLAVFTNSMKGMNGFHRRPLELYLIRINPACRIVWFYLLQVSRIFSFLISAIKPRPKTTPKLRPP